MTSQDDFLRTYGPLFDYQFPPIMPGINQLCSVPEEHHVVRFDSTGDSFIPSQDGAFNCKNKAWEGKHLPSFLNQTGKLCTTPDEYYQETKFLCPHKHGPPNCPHCLAKGVIPFYSAGNGLIETFGAPSSRFVLRLFVFVLIIALIFYVFKK